MKNQFGKTSELRISAAVKDGKTILDDVYFTAPFKIMNPFPSKKGIKVMLQSASAGIMSGDRQVFSMNIGEKANVEFISQSYEKIHKMESGYASRDTEVYVKKNAIFDFHPLPTIPFAESAYENCMNIELEDESAGFGLYEILSCGRAARGERFMYRKYESLVTVKRAGRLIYRDNAKYRPDQMPMEDMGLFEGYSHLANIFFTKNRLKEQQDIESIREIILQHPEVDGGITCLASGDYAMRVFGNRGQQLENFIDTLKTSFL